MTMNEFFKEAFSILSAKEKALKELEEAKKSYLEACTGREYANAMVTYQENRVRRLTAYLQSMEDRQNA